MTTSSTPSSPQPPILEKHTAERRGVGTPLEGTPARLWDPQATIAAPLQLHAPVVLPDWVDYNGHMSESCYLLVFGDNSDSFFRYMGIDESYRDQAGYSLYTVQTLIHNLREVAQGEPLQLHLQLLDHDDKRVHIFHSMFHATSGDLLATGEQMLAHVDMALGKSVAMPPTIFERFAAVLNSHARLPKPPQVGKPIAIRRQA